MAEIGTLGDIVFKVSANKVRTFDDLKIDSKTNYAKHTRHLKKPLLEFQYNDSDTASLTIYLSAFLGVNPKKMQDKIDKYRKKGKILTLIIGGKKYGSQWGITGHSKDYEKFDNQGNLFIAKSTLLLSSIEYDIPLNREFGLNAAYIDKPITTATALATADIYDKIGEYEPRAEIVSIEFTTDYKRGILKPKVEVEVNGEYDEYDEEYTE